MTITQLSTYLSLMPGGNMGKGTSIIYYHPTGLGLVLYFNWPFHSSRNTPKIKLITGHREQ
jgi:hypothetical protein